MNPCVINFSSGGWYPRGQQRLLASLRDTGWTGGVRVFGSTEELGCPSHEAAPYAFKPAAFNRVATEGYDVILWCDSAVWANRSIAPVIERIEKEGHILFEGGWNCAQWTNDTCLKNMGVSRDEAEKMPQISASCMGFDLRHPKAVEFLRRWTAYSLDGQSFRGRWNNHEKTESADPRCLGHRHDQTVASILSAQMGMAHTVGHPTYYMYYASADGSPFRYGQTNDMSKVSPEICFLTQGM